MPKVLYVLAIRREDYNDWLRNEASWPVVNDYDAVRYVGSIASLGRYKPGDGVIALKGWMQRDDWRQLYNRAIGGGSVPPWNSPSDSR